MTENKIMAAMLSALDDGIKNVTTALAATNQAENTLIIFTTDNGGTAGSSNYPLRGEKHSIFEGGPVLGFGQEFALEDAIGFHACSHVANMRVLQWHASRVSTSSYRLALLMMSHPGRCNWDWIRVWVGVREDGWWKTDAIDACF